LTQQLILLDRVLLELYECSQIQCELLFKIHMEVDNPYLLKVIHLILDKALGFQLLQSLANQTFQRFLLNLTLIL